MSRRKLLNWRIVLGGRRFLAGAFFRFADRLEDVFFPNSPSPYFFLKLLRKAADRPFLAIHQVSREVVGGCPGDYGMEINDLALDDLDVQRDELVNGALSKAGGDEVAS